uniref:Uncharacterized protein n=1 Tax=Anguilla anguilla TaxID=7936 RepID=A0A0E9PJ06_ANGAN
MLVVNAVVIHMACVLFPWSHILKFVHTPLLVSPKNRLGQGQHYTCVPV